MKTGEFTYFPGVPTMFHYLLQGAEGGKLPGMRLCISAGAIMPATLNREFEERFGIPLLDGYGITETSTMVTMNWPTRRRACSARAAFRCRASPCASSIRRAGATSTPARRAS